MSSKKPNLYIIAGPNGAGKTTFAEEFLPNYAKGAPFINADIIARGLSGFSSGPLRRDARSRIGPGGRRRIRRWGT